MEESEISLRSIFGLLRRQFRLILVTAVAVASLAAVWTFSRTPIYTGSTLLMFDPSQKNLLDPEIAMRIGSLDNARIDSEVEIMRSDNILLEVIHDKSLVNDDEFGVAISMRQQLMSLLRLGNAELPTGENAINQVLGDLRRAVTVQRSGLTYLISIQVRSRTPAKAADLANAIAQSYIADQVSSKINSTLAARDILQGSINSSRDAILKSEGAFDSFIASNIAQIVDDTGRTDIARMQNEIGELTRIRQQASITADLVQSQIAQGDFDSLVQSLHTDALRSLVQQRDELNQRIADAGEEYPVIIDLRASLSDIEDQLQTAASTEVERLRNQVSETQTQEATLRENLRSAVINSNLSADALTQIFELQQNAGLARSQYENLLARAQSLDTQSNLQVADSRVVSPALPPAGASLPSVTTTMLIAALLATALGVALAFLYENYLGGFTTTEQLESVLKLRVGATTPKARPNSDQKSIADLTVMAPLSIIAESTRRVRATIELIMRQRLIDRGAAAKGGDDQSDGAYVIMVTSSVPNEGKTTLALSLARSYALSGRSTLLIDCDLRKPDIHHQLGLEPSRGLVDVLTEGDHKTGGIGGALSVDPLSSVTVILGARRSSLPTDQLISSDSFVLLLESAKKSFSVIVVDTPPIGAVVDGLYVAPYADVVAFVVRWASTQQNEVKAAIAAIKTSKSIGVEIVTVLCQQDQSRQSYLNKYGDYYSDLSI